jgi:hypothetical protein
MGKLLLTALSLVLDGSNSPLVPAVDGLGQLLDAVVKVPLIGSAVALYGLSAEVPGAELIVGQIGPAESGEALGQVQRQVPSIHSRRRVLKVPVVV